jgi:hypothetical protein
VIAAVALPTLGKPGFGATAAHTIVVNKGIATSAAKVQRDGVIMIPSVLMLASKNRLKPVSVPPAAPPGIPMSGVIAMQNAVKVHVSGLLFVMTIMVMSSKRSTAKEQSLAIKIPA